MPLSNSQYEAILREYSRRQNENRRILEDRRAEAYRKLPRLRKIDEEEASLSSASLRSLLGGSSDGTASLRDSLGAFQEERLRVLTEGGFPADYLTRPCTCPICRDTGFVDGQKCVCFRQAEIDLLYSQAGLHSALQHDDFDHFSFDYYSADKGPSSGLSSRQLAQRAYEQARQFVRVFDNDFQNLFLYGDTGVGKTFLSHCIAGELLGKTHSVLYFPAYDLFEVLAQQAFLHQEEDSREHILSCDLLIIDDLGTELTNTFVSSGLFSIVNERLLRRKSTIISTNLSLEAFSDTYSERTFSRIMSSYHMLKLTGEDIRIQKKFQEEHQNG
ncbi:MAG: ATP-binding protein [Blautia sp.]|nr:ATP-binding protein [Blautia sp.]